MNMDTCQGPGRSRRARHPRIHSIRRLRKLEGSLAAPASVAERLSAIWPSAGITLVFVRATDLQHLDVYQFGNDRKQISELLDGCDVVSYVSCTGTSVTGMPRVRLRMKISMSNRNPSV